VSRAARRDEDRREPAQRALSWGAFSLVTFFTHIKKVTRPGGRNPGLDRNPRSGTQEPSCNPHRLCSACSIVSLVDVGFRLDGELIFFACPKGLSEYQVTKRKGTPRHWPLRGSPALLAACGGGLNLLALPARATALAQTHARLNPRSAAMLGSDEGTPRSANGKAGAKALGYSRCWTRRVGPTWRADSSNC
jgi:hypothetical protein